MSRAIRKLTFVTDATHFGGAERYLVDMARAAARRGIEPHIHWLAPVSNPSDVFTVSRVGSTRVTRAPSPLTRTATGVVRETRRMLRSEQPDALVINAAGRPRFWLIPWCARLAGIPGVWVHQMVEQRDHRREKPQWLGGRMEGPQWWRIPQTLRHRLAAAAATSLITLNAEDRERILRWQRIRRERIHVVPHGIDGRQFDFDETQRRSMRAAWFKDTPLTPGSLVVGTAGRLVTGKRIDLLIEAAALLVGRGVDIRVIIAGQGSQREALEQLAAERGLSSAVRFLDFVHEMPAFHNGLDVFALCSETESFGLVLAEAMACRRPVVATPTAGARRQIRHGHNGLLLPGFDSQDLADALQDLHCHPDQRERMGCRGRCDVLEHFSIELTLERTLRALRVAERSSIGIEGTIVTPPVLAHTAEDAT